MTIEEPINDKNSNEKRLTSKAKKMLRAQSHNITPVVWVGKEGVGKVIMEVKRQIKDRGLIKVKIRKGALEHSDKKEIAEKIAIETNSEIVSLVGNVITLFKPREGWKKYTTTKKPKKEKYIEEFEKFRIGRKLRK
ncbi:ribosome assembly RNA-binding protein YhbY [Methanothermococcus okinawensis]|uniref:RNA-binding, CRM domain protein n=1 Tax=Methanothermococcus okinawensis (strain DSM 14208 / JCM 11175 / IH1) TaxID=647113 RepID=F8ALR5_METOI|nr:ribosome assembly RNA-binding protein YhbY [Methanothermococcus okinawensis]AEH06621.1 RNA-binding, CRM domain protein [Methanothermococcus okinawensis IH1]